jgi:hypothetical protein
MTTIQITLDIPNALAQAAAQGGLLRPEAIEKLLRDALRGKDSDGFFEAAERLASSDIPDMSLEEIQAEIAAVRAAHKAAKV